MLKNIFTHFSSFVDKGCEIGEGTKVWHFCHIMSNAIIGTNCNIGQNVFIANNVKIGNNVKIQNNISIYEGVEIEDNCFLAPSCVFTNVKKPNSLTKQKYAKTLIKKGAMIGANSTIVCGITIGCNVIIGAGSVVTKDMPDNVIAYGNPAKIRT